MFEIIAIWSIVAAFIAIQPSNIDRFKWHGPDKKLSHCLAFLPLTIIGLIGDRLGWFAVKPEKPGKGKQPRRLHWTNIRW